MSKPSSPAVKSPSDSIDSLRQELRERIKQGADPINKDLENRYKGLVEEAQLQDKISIFEAQKLIQQYDQKGVMDLKLLREEAALKKSLALINSPKNDFSLTPYVPAISLVVVLLFLVWIKTINGYQKFYDFLLDDEKGLYITFLEAIGKAKPKVSESEKFLHNKAFNELRVLARGAIAVDNERFNKQEFLLFAKVQFCMRNGQKEYEGLAEYLKLFQAVLQAQKTCITLSQIEMSCQGSKQQRFYEFVNQELLNLDDQEVIKSQINNHLAEVSPQIYTEDGRLKLASYVQEMYELMEHPDAIAFFRKFKTTDLSNLQSIHKISTLIGGLREQEVTDLHTLIRLAMANYDDFEVLGEMIAMPEERRSPDAYGRVMQHMGLNNRYQESFGNFQLLLQKLQQWYKPYQTLIKIRQAHPVTEYRHPPEFGREIPGLSLFIKYKDSLTEQKIGYSYIDFEENNETAPSNLPDPEETLVQNQTNLQLDSEIRL
ncbi:MAG: hypothetical protein ACRC6M_18495 [Microcystaceae cyanobacterium]